MHAPCHRAHPREYAHEHYVSPPFDEDDELDLRALYRKTRSGSPELDAAVRRSWHPGHSWHPGWAAAACAFLVAGLFTWTNMRENADAPDSNPIAQLMAPSESGTDKDRPAAAESAVAQPQEAPAVQRAALPAPESALPPQQAAPRPKRQRLAPPSQAAAQEPAQAQAALSDEEIESRLAHIRSLMQDDQQEDAAHAQELRQAVPRPDRAGRPAGTGPAASRLTVVPVRHGRRKAA